MESTQVLGGGGNPGRLGKPAARRKRLSLERLEDRCTPAAFTLDSLADTQDANPGDGIAADANGATTLRAAIEESNALAGTDRINFGKLTGTITLSDTLKTLNISDNLFLTASEPDQVTVRRNPTSTVDFNIFNITSGVACTITGLTVSNGKADSGGGIYNSGTLVLSSCWIISNTANDYGGGIYNALVGDLQMISCLVYDNKGYWGGGIYASGVIDLQATVIDKNYATDQGGGLYSLRTVTASDSSLTNNSAWNGGGGWYNDSANATWTYGTISKNVCLNGVGLGGGIYHTGGGLSQLTLDSVEIRENLAKKGGGLYVFDKFVTMTNCTIEDNQALLGTAICYKPRSYSTYSFNGILNGTIAQDP